MRKNILTMFVAVFMMAAYADVNAQLQLPRPSPGATVTQTIGLTDATVEYSSPGVKGREIFGGLVPYGELWRTGANSSTTITFDRNVSIMDNEVPAGTYSLFTIPGESQWTVILNKDKNASTGSYSETEDLLRINVSPESCEFRERMSFMFANYDDDKGELWLEWDKTRVRVQIDVNTDKQARENIDSYLGSTWRSYTSSARYYLDQNMELDKGMEYVDQSIALNENWFNVWTKAELYKAMGNMTEAAKYAGKAKELGDQADNFFWKDKVYKAAEEWKSYGGKKGKK
jgi:hypothetical protein